MRKLTRLPSRSSGILGRLSGVVAAPTNASAIRLSTLRTTTSINANDSITALVLLSIESTMGWPSREELIRLMGLDDTQSKDGSYIQDLLATLRHQRESNPDEENVKGERTGFYYASLQMYEWTFRTITEPYYDRRRKCLWYLGWRVCSSINCASFLIKAGPEGTRIPRARDSKDLPHHARESVSLRLCRPKTTFETDREIRHA